MSEVQTQADFTRNLNTTFRVQLDDSRSVDIKLVAVDARQNEPNEQADMERFSAVFSGPLDSFLQQRTYNVAHPDMGEFVMFLVAIAKDADSYRYEAVYNTFKPKALD